MKRVTLPIVMDYRSADRLTSISLRKGLKGISQEAAVREVLEYECRPGAYCSVFTEQTEELVNQLTDGNPSLIETNFDEYLGRYLTTIEIEFPIQIIQDVRSGIFDPQGWEEIARTTGISYFSSEPSDKIEQYFSLIWRFEVTTRSDYTYEIQITSPEKGIFEIDVYGGETNRLTDKIHDSIGELLFFDPSLLFRDRDMPFTANWGVYDTARKDGSNILLNHDLAKDRSFGNTHFAKIFL